jgi:hypothetical protein
MLALLAAAVYSHLDAASHASRELLYDLPTDT